MKKEEEALQTQFVGVRQQADDAQGKELIPSCLNLNLNEMLSPQKKIIMRQMEVIGGRRRDNGIIATCALDFPTAARKPEIALCVEGDKFKWQGKPLLPLRLSWVEVLKQGQMWNNMEKSHQVNGDCSLPKSTVHCQGEVAPTETTRRPGALNHATTYRAKSWTTPPEPVNSKPSKKQPETAGKFKMHYMEPGPISERGAFVIPSQIEDIGAAIWTNTIVSKLVGRPIPVAHVRKIFTPLWEKKGLTAIILHGPGVYFF